MEQIKDNKVQSKGIALMTALLMAGFAAVGVIGTTAVVKPEWLPGIVKAPILYFSVFLDIMIIPFVIDELWWVIPFIFAPMLLGIIYILSRLARGGG